MSPAAGGMIAKTFFLVKIIHRIGTRSLRSKKSLHENLAGYRISVLFALRSARQAVPHNPQDLRFRSFSLVFALRAACWAELGAGCRGKQREVGAAPQGQAGGGERAALKLTPAGGHRCFEGEAAERGLQRVLRAATRYPCPWCQGAPPSPPTRW
jgi:hypothetical protein